MKYSDAGVDRDLLRELKKRIKAQAEKTHNSSVYLKIGHFGSAYDLSCIGMPNKVLVQSVDGVGTMLELALIVARSISRDTLYLKVCGESLVNHCVNDILCLGVKPLTFLDCISSDNFSADEVEAIVCGMVDACRDNSISLVGGEIAQMPGYDRKLDIVGFITGIADKDKIIDGSVIKPEDVLIGLPSLGVHTNGYSLIRRSLSKRNFAWNWGRHILELHTYLADALLKPHKSYAKIVGSLLDASDSPRGLIRGIAHITGGGLQENLARILPANCKANIRLRSWPALPIFQWIQKAGDVPTDEMFRVFNMGIGMVLVAAPENLDLIFGKIRGLGEECYLIGEVKSGERQVCFYEEDRSFCF